jgi:hypothetical protein
MLHDMGIVMTLYEYLEQKVQAPIDYSDLLRWQWVQAVSSLDKFIHDIVRIGMIEIYMGNRQPTKKYLTFKIDMETHSDMIQNQNNSVLIFERYVILKNSQFAFQDPDKIGDALSHIWNEEHKWKIISEQMGKTEPNVKTQLKNISLRRNQIVHEGDCPGISLPRQDIFKVDVINVILFIKELENTIFNLVIQHP